MKEIYEKKETVIKTDEVTKETKEEIDFKEVKKEDADHIHYCGHDKNPPEPCRRVKL